ncbi:MAG: CpaF family protein [Rickettsiales bacterium]
MFGKKASDQNQLIDGNQFRDIEKISLKNKFLTINHEDVESEKKEHGDWYKVDEFFRDSTLENAEYASAKSYLTEKILDKLEFSILEKMDDDVKRDKVRGIAGQIIRDEISTPLTAAQIELLKEQAIDDLLGFGPLEVLLSDPDVSDIMINGSKRVFVEKYGKIALTDVTFTSEKHLLNVIQKIVSIVGRRVDEANPMVDARMPDGSRFNAIIPPLSLDGSLVSIRKFRRQKISLKEYVDFGSMTPSMVDFLAICGYIRLNILISGGTGSGKTTLLNAMSGNIAHTERVITVEDAAELQLQQPHVLRMETRPPNMQGVGEITARQLVKNALRMRPDRIIIGEIRSDEVIDVLSAMNTGHDGSMATIHANTPKDALSRIENLVGMSNVSMSAASLKNQIASALHLIVQVARQRDGKRRITHIEEIIGMKDGEIERRLLFSFHPGEMGEDGVLTGEFRCSGEAPDFRTQAAYFGKEKEMLKALGISKDK